MRTTTDTFHLAIPCYDLDEAQHFYVTLLGCKLARRYDDRITLDFFGDQVVCHLCDPATRPAAPESMYPRHFGVTFRESADFEALHKLAEMRKVPFYSELAVRFEGLVEAHRTFVLRDPSDNLLEFKHYDDHRMMY
jgi:extradiol dioxygenase family protein